jgi:hypothetical protein
MEAGIKPAADTCRALGMAVAIGAMTLGHCQRSREALLELSGKLKPSGFAAGIEREVSGWETSLPDTLTSILFEEKQT